MKDYYRILNIRYNASANDIKQAYRASAKRYHPDTNPGDRTAAAKLAEVNEAYDALGDAKKKAAYDAQLRRELDAARKTPPERYAEQMQREAQAQMQKAIDLSVQAQLEDVRDRAYREGYERGCKEGQAIAGIGTDGQAAQAEEVRRRLAETTRDRRELEEELFERDRELGKANDKIRELTTQLTYMQLATGGAKKSPLSASLQNAQNQVAVLRKAMDTVALPEHEIQSSITATYHEKRKQLLSRFATLDRILAELNTETHNCVDMGKRLQKATNEEQLFASLTVGAAEWAKKNAEDVKRFKDTLYAKLGVLPWATEQDLRDAYEKLHAQSDGDTKRQQLEEAYAVLKDPVRRAAYNKRIGISEESIRTERKLASENEKEQKEYREKLASHTFWQYYDELVSLALSGDADAQCALGDLYAAGDKVSRDDEQAVYWYKEAMHQSHPLALHRLGMCYYLGKGVRRNRTIALACMRQADNLHAPFAEERDRARNR